jgi:phage-related protein
MSINLIKVLILPEAEEFLRSLSSEAYKKVYYNISKVRQGYTSAELFKKLTDNIWEFRTLYKKQYIRLFAFYDANERSLIVATHGIIKKTDKTPKREIVHAERIRTDFINDNL